MAPAPCRGEAGCRYGSKGILLTCTDLFRGVDFGVDLRGEGGMAFSPAGADQLSLDV